MTCSNESFNTASGMDCMQWQRIIRGKLFTLFQYRKRYGLHAMKKHTNSLLVFHRFNTASGMDCMQSVRKSVVLASSLVSIPQAVWIACNNIDEVAVEKVESAVSIPQAVWIACNKPIVDASNKFA